MPEACSDCCSAPLKVGGRGTTHWWICTACAGPCNAVPTKREALAMEELREASADCQPSSEGDFYD